MEALLAAMLLLGLASGVHCIGMCGGIAGAFALKNDPLKNHALKKIQPLKKQLAFNAGRITTYAAAGALAGTLGSAAQYAGLALPAQAALYVLANVVLLFIGLQLAGVANPLRSIEALGVPLWRRLQPLAARLLPSSTLAGAFAAGSVWGWLPCGLVYGALATAMFAGSPARGAAAMAAFGLGTLPWLLAAGLAAARLRSGLARRPLRLAIGAAVGGFGAFGLAHAAGATEAIRRGLLCL